MRLQVYQGRQLAATFEYGHAPTYHGKPGQRVRAAIEAWRGDVPKATMPGVPVDWLRWAASVVYPALKAGAFVRWQG